MLVPRFGVFAHLVYYRSSDKLSLDEKMVLQKKGILACNKTLVINVMAIEGYQERVVFWWNTIHIDRVFAIDRRFLKY